MVGEPPFGRSITMPLLIFY